MKDIGIRELKAHASAIVRKVAEDRATYTVTHRGRPVGILSPAGLERSPSGSGGVDAWARFEELARRIGASGRKRRSGVHELDAMRR